MSEMTPREIVSELEAKGVKFVTGSVVGKDCSA